MAVDQRHHRPRPPRPRPEATPDDVAALITARTKDAAGRELGHWSDDTRPTVEQVQMRIDIARALVAKQVEGPIPEQCLEGAESAVAILAAMLCEAAFWPEQTQSNQSTYERLEGLYSQAREGVLACVAAYYALDAYDLDVSGGGSVCWPIDWWQRDLDNPVAARDLEAAP